MQQKPPNVLILYNAPRDLDLKGRPSAWRESDAGVVAEVQAVSDALHRQRVDHRRVGIVHLRDVGGVLAATRENVVFNLVEELDEPLDACLVPKLCGAYGKACTGCDTPALILAADKWRTKLILGAAGLPCPPGGIVPPGQESSDSQGFEGPFIVKPLFSDASEGIDAASVVPGPGPALRRAVERIHREFEQPALIEQFVGHRELNVSLLERDGRVEVLPIAEIDFAAFGQDRPRLMDYSAKWLPDSFEFQNTPRVLPAPLSDSEAEAIRNLALRAWSVLGCHDYARVDIRVDEQGRPFILELNANPDISPDAGFTAALAAGGVAYEDFVSILTANALSRMPAACRPARTAGARPRSSPRHLRIRGARSEDRALILSLLKGTERFRPGEMDVATFVLDESLKSGDEGPYHSRVVEDARQVVGWVCFGPTPCTLDTYDIYWMAVALQQQRRGVGTSLIRHAEAVIRERGGRMVAIETSGTPDYAPAWQFYKDMGYQETARITDFYAPGDDKLVFTKRLQGREVRILRREPSE